MTHDRPGVAEATSVVIAAFNAELTIGGTVDSALEIGMSQVTVVDDGSTDQTASVARSRGATVLTQTNAGAAVARRVGLAVSTGEFVVFLDADDRLLPDILKCVETLRADPQLGVAAGKLAVLGDNGTIRKQRIHPGYVPVDTATLLLHGYAPWPPVAAVFRRAALRRAAQIDPEPIEPGFAEDYELLLRCSRVGGIGVCDEVVAAYAVSGGKSGKQAELSIDSAARIASYYGNAWQMEFAKWDGGARRRLVATRSLQATYDLKGPIGLLRAALGDDGVRRALAASAARRIRMRLARRAVR